MQDRYLFRGKRLDNGEWVVGLLSQMLSHSSTIRAKIGDEIEPVKVITSTVSQCTGLKDKNGELIFEGDCIGHKFNVVEWSNGCFCTNGDRGLLFQNSNCQITGNIHDRRGDHMIDKAKRNAIRAQSDTLNLRSAIELCSKIPSLLDALEESEAECDRWKARAQAMEGAINQLADCGRCIHKQVLGSSEPCLGYKG